LRTTVFETKTEGITMTDSVYTARSSVAKVAGVHRRATLADRWEVDFGVHGPVKQHFGLTDEPDLALPVDHLVAAAAA